MLKLALSITSYVKIKKKEVNITNLVFKLHYIATCGILLLGCAVVCSHEWVGEKIMCTHSDPEEGSAKKLDHVISQYCFFMSLFTVDRHHNKSVSAGEVAHPGIGAWNEDRGDEVTYYKWYQWVPYVLLLQALSFYVPYFIWKAQEKKSLSRIVLGFDIMKLMKCEGEKIYNETVSKFNDRVKLMKPWCTWMFICEALNLANVVLQFWLTDLFLGGTFASLGWDVIKFRDEPNYNPLDVAFPKVAKCVFKKFGPTGSIQVNDVLCVLSINIASEKIYLIFWWWYIFLFIVSLGMVIHRLISRVAYSSRLQYNMKVLTNTMTVKPEDRDVSFLVQNLEFSEWIFLSYVLSNMDGLLGKGLLRGMARSKLQENQETYSATAPEKLLSRVPRALGSGEYEGMAPLLDISERC